MPHVRKAEKRDSTLIRKTKSSVEGSPRPEDDDEVSDADETDVEVEVDGKLEESALDDIALTTAAVDGQTL
ncbi:hypothetical protein ID866_4127 [Astraeus odoratus]|nr:hypothetical protein ID866_4127 [Astraeus odoratus]